MLEYEYVQDAARLPAIANELAESQVLSLDTETTGLDPHTSKIRLLSLNTGKGKYVIDAFRCQTLEPVINALRDSQAVKIGQNLKFDQKMFMVHHGLELTRIFDTYRASAILHNGRKVGNNLWDLYARELNMAPQTGDLGGSDWSLPELSKNQLDYAAEDIIWLPALRDKLKPQLAAAGLNQCALLEFQAILPESAIEVAGFYLDTDSWRALAMENVLKAGEMRRELLAHLPNPAKQTALPGFDMAFNVDSTQQLTESLRMLNIHVPDTKEMTLAMLVGKHPLLQKIIDYRGVAQLVKTFGEDFLENINPITGRIHTSFFPYTGAGRYASSKPNLQQIPRDKRFRKCFKAAPGKKLIIADYSQIELRLVAEISRDETLIAAYNKGIDAHTMTAAIVSGKKLEEVTKDERQLAKPVNFGLIYGLMPPKLVTYAQANYGVSMTLAQAKKFWQRYFEGYAGIRAWHNKAIRDGKREQMSRTLSGRRRFLEGDQFHNEFYNTPVQGSGADGLKNALWIVYHELKKYGGRARIVHMVHDEIVIECDDDKELCEAVQHSLEQGMIAGMRPFVKSVPVVVEGGIGETWAEK